MLCPRPITTRTNSPEQRDKRGAFVTTYSGAKFFIDECNIADIPMFDIAHALSMNCRFNGHVKRHYSVAEHSLLVSDLVPPEYAMTGLLHDLSEAFVPDIPRPFKSSIGGFEEYEDRIMRAASKHYPIVWPFPEEVKYIDKNIVGDEANVLYEKPPSWTEFYNKVCPHHTILGLEAEAARTAFLCQFNRLMYQHLDRK